MDDRSSYYNDKSPYYNDESSCLLIYSSRRILCLLQLYYLFTNNFITKLDITVIVLPNQAHSHHIKVDVVKLNETFSFDLKLIEVINFEFDFISNELKFN